MSIIHEALKKVQSNRSENKSVNDKISTTKTPTPTAKPLPDGKVNTAVTTSPKPSFNYTPYWCSLIFILAGATLYNLYEFTVRTTEMSMSKFSAASVQPFKAEPILAPAPTPAPIPVAPKAQPQKGEIILSGIVLMDGKNFALINNKFYEVGETVEEAQITKITTDSIDILQKGKARTIKVLRPD